MLNKQQLEIILEYSLENKENLTISLGAHAIYERIRETIICRFLDELEKVIRERIDDAPDAPDPWKITNEIKNNFNDRWAGFYIAKKSWGDEYRIGFQPQITKQNSMYIGVAKDEKTPPVEELFKKLRYEFGEGEEFEWWDWWTWVDDDNKYRHWGDDKTLLNLYIKEEGVEAEAVEYFANFILRIKNAATALIDAQVAKNKTE